MLKKLVNEAFCTLHIETTGPLLVKSGHANVVGPDMTPVVTYRNKRNEVFIPGSSLKGVFRSHLEKIICGISPGVVCYPFESANERQADPDARQHDYRDSCGGLFTAYSKKGERYRQELEERTDLVYKASCPTCRLFGSTGFIGRLAISDAYLVGDAVLERRDGVGIDRLTGGASHGAKFELEVVATETVFECDIHLRNFEIWQLGMLFIVLEELQDELISIGSGRSRGLGKVRASLVEKSVGEQTGKFMTSSLLESEEPDNQVWGLGRWLNNGSYGTWEDDYVRLGAEMKPVARGIRNIRAFGEHTNEQFTALRQAARTQFLQRMKNWPKEFARLPEPASRS